MTSFQRRISLLKPMNDSRNQLSWGNSLPPISYKELIRVVGVDPDLGPSSWRKAIDHSADTVVFYQVDIRAAVPYMCKSIRILRGMENGIEQLLPSVYIGSAVLGLSYVKTVIGRSYLADEDDLMKLLEHAGMLQTTEEAAATVQESDCYLSEPVADDMENSVPYPSHLADEASPRAKRVKRAAHGAPKPASRQSVNSNPSKVGLRTDTTSGRHPTGGREATDLTNLLILTPTNFGANVPSTSTANGPQIFYVTNNTAPTKTVSQGEPGSEGASEEYSLHTEKPKSQETVSDEDVEVIEKPDADDSEWDEGQEGGIGKSGSKSKKRPFTDEQHRFIITQRLDMEDQFLDTKMKKPLWDEIVESMKEYWPLMPHTAANVAKRFENSFHKYKTEKRTHHDLGRSRSTWPYFDLFDSVYGRRQLPAKTKAPETRASTGQVEGASSSESPTAGDDANEGNSNKSSE